MLPMLVERTAASIFSAEANSFYSAIVTAFLRQSAGGGALERGLLSNPRPPDLSNQIMSPALWFPFRGLTKLSHPGKKPAEGLRLKSIGPRKIKRKRN